MLQKSSSIKHNLKYLLIAILFFSCGTTEQKTDLDYRLGKDGLIYDTNTNKLFTGTIIDTTEVIIEIEVVAGKKHGIFTTYYLNGNIEKQGRINENSNEGEWKYFYQDGSIESKGSYKNDKPDGTWTFYYQNGIKKEEGKFRDGERAGKWVYFDEKGEVINELDFDSGEILKDNKSNLS